MDEPQKSTDDDDRIENARVGYQTAINLWVYVGEQIWARFNVMLLANSIIISVIVINSKFQSPIFTKVLSFVGLAICFAWYLLMRRANGYQTYYMTSARELEEKYLFNQVRTVSRGDDFAKGREVDLKKDGKPLAMPCWGRLTSEMVSYIVILSFFVVYIYFLVSPE